MRLEIKTLLIVCSVEGICSVHAGVYQHQRDVEEDTNTGFVRKTRAGTRLRVLLLELLGGVSCACGQNRTRKSAVGCILDSDDKVVCLWLKIGILSIYLICKRCEK
jgi:hypothetical protein